MPLRTQPGAAPVSGGWTPIPLPLKGLAGVALAVLAINAAVGVGAAIDAWLRHEEWSTLAAVERTHDRDQRSALVAREGFFGLLHVGAFLLGAATFLPWFYRAVSNAKRTRHGRSIDGPGWAIAGFFVPVLHFFKPAVLMTELASVSRLMGASADGSRPTRPTAGAVRLWWACWLGAQVLSVVALASSVGVGMGAAMGARDQPLARLEADSELFAGIYYVAMLFAAATLARLVVPITALQESARRAADAGPTPA
jgi:hypothetical protein